MYMYSAYGCLYSSKDMKQKKKKKKRGIFVERLLPFIWFTSYGFTYTEDRINS